MILTTSNKNKIKEFKDILGNDLIIQSGKDIKEVDGTMDEVILYKSLEAGKGFIVEDTILICDGKEVVDIRWNQEDKLKNIKTASWIVSLGYNDGKNLNVFRGIINGIIVEPKCEGFGFDPYFLPDGSDITLAELDKQGLKNNFSARKIALLNLKNNNFYSSIKINEIEKWNGKYQNEE